MKIISKNSGAYIASGEKATLLCSYGTTPSKALKKMANIIDMYANEVESSIVQGINLYYEDDIVYINATITTLV